MTDINIVVVYNNETLLEQMKDSIISKDASGSLSYEVIALDNTRGRFKSAAEAYNYALDNLCGAKCVVFCHQDIIFKEHSLQDIYDICSVNDRTLIGAAGVMNNRHNGWNAGATISAMSEGKDGIKKYDSLSKGTTREVFTLDECLIAAHRELFDEVRFDPVVCDGWHLYAVDLCLQCHLKGIRVLVYDANIIHLSGGNLNKSFYACESKLARKYRRDYKEICYTCGWTYTNPILLVLLRWDKRFRIRHKCRRLIYRATRLFSRNTE